MYLKNFLHFILYALFISNSNAQNYHNELVETVESLSSETGFEGTILIADKGKVIYWGAFGHADSKEEIEVQQDMYFGIASITKMVTAIITLQLVDEGKLQLNDAVNSLLPEIEIPDGDRITIHHLLLHISGLPNEKNKDYRELFPPIEFVEKALKRRKSGREIGQYNYNNIDYVLLGLIIESKDGRSWQESVRARILKPLKMDNSGFLSHDSYPDHFANTFSYEGKQKRKEDPRFYIENFGAAGCMYSTAEDLLKLDQGMYGTTILSEERKKEMFTSYPEYNYTGYSVWTYNYPFIGSQPLIMERRGGILGSNSVLVRFLETNRTLIILSNTDRFNPDSFGDKENLREALIRELAKIE